MLNYVGNGIFSTNTFFSDFKIKKSFTSVVLKAFSNNGNDATEEFYFSPLPENKASRGIVDQRVNFIKFHDLYLWVRSSNSQQLIWQQTK
jgi:hypothetical protein